MNIHKIAKDDMNWTDITMDGAKEAQIKVTVGEEHGAPNFVMRIFKVQAKGHTPLHSHDWEHVNYILKGNGVLRNSKGEELPIKAGDNVLVPPFEEHQYFNNSNDELEFICLIPIMRK